MVTMVIATVLAAQLALFWFGVLVPRWRMERRAQQLLQRHPGARTTALAVAFDSAWPPRKHREMQAAIAKMKAAGWTFLRATKPQAMHAALWSSFGGGVVLHFIKTRLPVA